MASTKPIKAEYSAKLDSMAAYIRAFLSKRLDDEVVLRTHKGIADFCYKNSVSFKREFLQSVGLSKLKTRRHAVSENPYSEFISKLSEIDRECVFLLKDTHDVLNLYQQKTGKGFGLFVNRQFLCRTEDDYFELIKLIYDALAKSNNLADFTEKYFSGFQKLIKSEPHFLDKAKKFFDYVSVHVRSQKIVFVDLGFQFTFLLFCSAAIRYFSNGKINGDFYSYSVYPWLQEFFKGRYFSKRSETVLGLELEAIKNFQFSLKNKAAGALVGFAIGDALGFPIAGIDKSDVPKFIKEEIANFTDNSKHPFFHHLRSGQYTENTNLLMISVQHLIRNHGFVPQKYKDDLVKWGKRILKNHGAERWAGPTAINAIKNLMKGKSYLESGSTTTESCSATYRVLPLGIFYRPFAKDGVDELKNNAKISAMFTHNSEISKAGAVVTALIIGDLMHGMLPEQAIKGVLEIVEETEKTKLLMRKIRQAVDMSRTESIESARKFFGTGSPIYQTLPLAIFCFLKFQTDFEKAVIAAANSYRDDTAEEKERLQKFSWEEQLQYAEGGNTDGIAGLTGVFAGTYLGLNKIPRKFLSVENSAYLAELGKKLV